MVIHTSFSVSGDVKNFDISALRQYLLTQYGVTDLRVTVSRPNSTAPDLSLDPIVPIAGPIEIG